MTFVCEVTTSCFKLDYSLEIGAVFKIFEVKNLEGPTINIVTLQEGGSPIKCNNF